MEIKDIIKEILKIKTMGQVDLAVRMNLTKQALYSKLKHENMGVKTLAYILTFMDYKIAIVPRSAKLPKDSFEITEVSIPVSNDGRRK